MSRAIATRAPAALGVAAARHARRAGWLLVASFVLFIGFVVATIVGNSGYQTATREVADRLGVGVNDIPARVLAPINHQYVNPVGSFALLAWVLVVFAVFVVGLRAAARIPADDRGPLRLAMTALAAFPMLCWIVIVLLDFGIGVNSPPAWVLDLYDALWKPATAASTVTACLALICLVLLLKPTGIGRRTGVVVVVLCVLSVVVAIFVGAPPVIPGLLSAVLGVLLIRSARVPAVA